MELNISSNIVFHIFEIFIKQHSEKKCHFCVKTQIVFDCLFSIIKAAQQTDSIISAQDQFNEITNGSFTESPAYLAMIYIVYAPLNIYRLFLWFNVNFFTPFFGTIYSRAVRIGSNHNYTKFIITEHFRSKVEITHSRVLDINGIIRYYY